MERVWYWVFWEVFYKVRINVNEDFFVLDLVVCDVDWVCVVSMIGYCEFKCLEVYNVNFRILLFGVR